MFIFGDDDDGDHGAMVMAMMMMMMMVMVMMMIFVAHSRESLLALPSTGSSRTEPRTATAVITIAGAHRDCGYNDLRNTPRLL